MGFLSIFKKKSFYIILVGVLGVAAYLAFGRNTEPEFETQVLSKQTVTQIVSETGVIQAAEAIDLSFASSGRIGAVLVDQGDEIKAGQVLATLESGSLNAELRQAQAQLEREKVLLSDLFEGATPEDVALTENSRQIAQTALDNARSNLITVMRNAYVTADDAVQAKADQLFDSPRSTSPTFGITFRSGNTTYSISGTQSQRTAINSLRRQAETELSDLKTLLDSESILIVEDAVEQTEETLRTVQQLLNEIANAINGYVADDSTAQAIYEGYKFDISSARTSVNSAVSSVSTAKQTYNSAKAALNTPQAELDYKNADPTANQIKLQELRVEEAQARVDGVAARISDATIVSPVDGFVTKKLASRGQVIAATSPALSVISNDELEISVYLAEDDIENVGVNDRAEITFDAYHDLMLEARVIFINVSAEEIEGVPSFEVKLLFNEPNELVKAGLSADVDIVSKEVNNVLAVPLRSVVEEGTVRYVRVMVGDKTFGKRAVELGLRGDNGFVEVTKGLSEGDEVITFIEEADLEKLSEE